MSCIFDGDCSRGCGLWDDGACATTSVTRLNDPAGDVDERISTIGTPSERRLIIGTSMSEKATNSRGPLTYRTPCVPVSARVVSAGVRSAAQILQAPLVLPALDFALRVTALENLLRRLVGSRRESSRRSSHQPHEQHQDADASHPPQHHPPAHRAHGRPHASPPVIGTGDYLTAHRFAP